MDNLIRREVARQLATHGKPMVGLVDSYDPKEHAVKVKLPTELDANGQPKITGWLKIRTAGGGGGNSFVFGPNIGDQCDVEFNEHDPEGGRVTGFLHNDVDRPPVVQSGEAALTTPHGVSILIDKNGGITISTTNGNVTMSAQNFNLTGNLTVSGNVAFSGGTLQHNSHDVGSTHKHTGVTTGSGVSGQPQ